MGQRPAMLECGKRSGAKNFLQRPTHAHYPDYRSCRRCELRAGGISDASVKWGFNAQAKDVSGQQRVPVAVSRRKLIPGSLLPPDL